LQRAIRAEDVNDKRYFLFPSGNRTQDLCTLDAIARLSSYCGAILIYILIYI